MTGKLWPQNCLQNCSPIWRPHLIKDIISLKGIQRRAAKIILETRSLNCRDRLVALKLFLLMYYFEFIDFSSSFPTLKTHLQTFEVKLTLVYSRTVFHQGKGVRSKGTIVYNIYTYSTLRSNQVHVAGLPSILSKLYNNHN